MLNEYEICCKCTFSDCYPERKGCLLKKAKKSELTGVEPAKQKTEGMKRCTRCGKEKPLIEFWRRLDGYQSACKDCARKAKGVKYTRPRRVVVEGEPRKCKICGKTKPARDFYWRADNHTWFSECMECTKKLIKERRQCLNVNVVKTRQI